MSNTDQAIRFLDNQLHTASEKDAAFQVISGVNHGRYGEVLETYNHKYSEAAEALSKKTHTEPIGVGANMETKTIAGIELLWREDAWRDTGVGYTLKIGPECDQNDVTAWLEKFKPIKKKILSRTYSLYDPLEFVLGESANKINQKCVAFALGAVVGFPTTKNGSHLIGIKLAQASKLEPELLPVEFSNIILHEVGHTMRSHYPGHRESLIVELAGASGSVKWSQTETVLKEISPHYLGEQFSAMLASLAAHQAKEWAEPERPKTKKESKLIQTMAGELFAEACRHFYLEAVLEGVPKEFKNTGFNGFDELCNEMCKQAKLTIAKSKKPIEYDDLEFD